ncbi:hypothetical protein, partial [Mycobacterium talmoniae]|uniref:hypothetical protein n=1 Tax=Mycobacterium talmoniae TaxID=1858794 RepID=UPI001A9729C9
MLDLPFAARLRVNLEFTVHGRVERSAATPPVVGAKALLTVRFHTLRRRNAYETAQSAQFCAAPL